MMNEQIWNSWRRDWDWVLDCVERKGGSVDAELQIAPPDPIHRVREIERAHGLVLSEEFVQVVTGYSAAVSLYWSLDDLDTGESIAPPAQYGSVSSGGCLRDWDLWNIETMPRYQRDLQGSMKRNAQNRTAFIHTMNGDFYALDTSRGRRECPVVYVDHELGSRHGIRLGLDFVDFITRWSNLGCPGDEVWQMMPFYDPVRNLLMDTGKVVENWKRWMDK